MFLTRVGLIMFAKPNGAVARACFLRLCLLCLCFPGLALFAWPPAALSAAAPALSISGSPAAAVASGDWYLFRTRVFSAGDGTLRFAIENKPRWATFDPDLGSLQGIPSDADVGTYANIRISVTDGISGVSLPAFSIGVRSSSARGSASLSWMPPLDNEDGSVLTDLVGYRIYAGRSPAALTIHDVVRSVGLTRYMITALESGRHYFAITAVNAAGTESKRSAIVSALIP
jgi:hypothetical protein